MSETLRRSLALIPDARRPLTARVAAIVSLLAAAGALACGLPTETEPDSRVRRVKACLHTARSASDPRSNDFSRSDSTAADTARATVTPTVPWF
jgi:hypothetical protein